MTWVAVDRGHGWAVEDEHGLTIAWIGQGSIFKASGVHSITLKDCKRHAKMIAAVPTLISALRTCQAFINEGPATRVAAEVAQEVTAALDLDGAQS